MFVHSYGLIRLQLFFISPIFPFLLGIILFLIWKSFDFPILCEGETIEDLNNTLLDDITKYKNIMEDYNYYDDNRWAAVNNPIRKIDKIIYLNKKASDNIESATILLAKIRKTEFSIQKLEPSFKSNIPRQWFEINLSNMKNFEWKA